MKSRLAVMALLGIVLFTSGCAGMTTQERQAVRADVLLGMEILAAGVAGMPNTDPAMAYWSRYAAGVLGKRANPTASASQVAQ